MTLECLEAVRSGVACQHQIIVVDNSSSDGSAESIREKFPEVHLISLDQNLGFAAANNLAAKQASGDYILLLNPDTVVLDDCIHQVLDFAVARPNARIWGGRTLFGDRTLNPASAWRRISLWSCICEVLGLTKAFSKSEVFNREAYGGWKRDSVRQVDIVSGCFLLISRLDWQALGGFDETFFMYGEDADLCLRATQDLGALPAITPKATLIHYGGASENVREDKIVRLLRAKVELVLKHTSKPSRAATYYALRLWPLSRWLMYTAAGAIKRSGSFRSRAEIWHNIWKRRIEWEGGFSDETKHR